jgi:RNA polymerase sigma-70 factor (ECF subfamily)
MLTEELIVKGCQKQNAEAQMALYKKYAGKMNAVCFRYVNSTHDAKDICQEGFIKVFSSINKYKGEGSFEGWIRRIMVNTAIDYLKDRKKQMFVSMESNELSEDKEDGKVLADMEQSDDFSIFNADLSNEQLLEMINTLPEVYKIVFNLHCIENYSHKEIGEMLFIQTETSRSRLKRARNLLKSRLREIFNNKLSNLKITQFDNQ